MQEDVVKEKHTHIREGMQYKEKYKSEKASKKWSSMSSWHHHDYRLEYITGEAIFMQDKRNNIACDLFLSLSWLLIHSSAWLDMQCSWHGNFVSFDFLVRSLIVQSHSFTKKSRDASMTLSTKRRASVSTEAFDFSRNNREMIQDNRHLLQTQHGLENGKENQCQFFDSKEESFSKCMAICYYFFFLHPWSLNVCVSPFLSEDANCKSFDMIEIQGKEDDRKCWRSDTRVTLSQRYHKVITKLE